jgi:hypothetical protein
VGTSVGTRSIKSFAQSRWTDEFQEGFVPVFARYLLASIDPVAGTNFRNGVTTGRTQFEYKTSALPPKADRFGGAFSFVRSLHHF